MKKLSLKGTSIIEAMVVLVVVVSGITSVYALMNSSQKLSQSTALRIEAIQIARDGLEAFTNMRDTNWLKFAADYENCWNVLNYNSNCIGASTDAHRIQGFQDGIDRRPYYITKNANDQFELGFISYPNGTLRYSNPSFRNDFRVGYDANGFYTQSGSIVSEITNPIFLRYLAISYPDGGTDTDKIRVRSVVQWTDSSKTGNHTVELETILTNWKAKQ